MPCGVVAATTTTEICHICEEDIAINDIAFFGTLRSKGLLHMLSIVHCAPIMHVVSFLSLQLNTSKHQFIGEKASKRGAGKNDERKYRHKSCHFEHDLLSKTIWTFQGFKDLNQETQMMLYEELKTSMRDCCKDMPKLPKEWRFLDPSIVAKPKPPTKRRCLRLVL